MNRLNAGTRSSLVSEQLSDIGSNASGSRRGASLPLKVGPDGDDQEDDEIATTAQAVELAIFGVLYTLSKEKVDGSKWLASLKMVLDFLQQLVLLLSPKYGWYPWTTEWTSRSTWLWKGLSYLDFRDKLTSLGYTVYEGFLYATGALLLCSLLLCAYVGYCFKKHKFAYVWPVWTLRVVVSVFYQTFYVSAMGIFLVSINCHWLAPSNSKYRRGYLDVYNEKCLDYPYILNLVLSFIFMVIFSTMVFVTTAADFELNPLAKGLLSAAHPRVEVINLAAKTVFLLASAILVVDVPKLQAVIFALSMAIQFYTVIRWVPAFRGWVNHVRAGFNLGLTWVTIMLTVLRCMDSAADARSDVAERLTVVALAGIPGLVVAGVFLSWVRLSYFTRRALGAFREAPSSAKQKDIYKFVDVYEVEIASRVCRTPGVESGTVEEASVKLAERILKAGIAIFSADAYAHILYSNLLIEVQTLYQAGQSQLMAAKKLNPGYVEKFAIFVREQQHMQRAHTQTTGESAVDLVSYVEFQRNYRLLARTTHRALTAQQAFWRLLLNGQVHFSQLTSAFSNIEAAQKNATQTYRMVLDRYPNSVKLLRSYARFQEAVVNNPWRATQLYEKADRLEEQQAAVHDNILYSVDNRAMLTQVDDKTSAVAVINASGTIQMTNKTMQKLFGYKASELDGQPVSMLMPAPFSSRHQSYIAAYLATGQAKIIDSVRHVIALHRRRYMFPVRLAVTKLSGQGQDSTFMGVMQPIEDDASCITVWCLPSGTALSVDQRFQDVFGLAPSEVIGRNFKDLLVEQDEFQGLMNMAINCSEEDIAARRLGQNGMHVQHKYAGPVAVDVTIQRGGTADEPLHVFSLSPSSMMAPPLVVFNRGGSVVFANSAMSQLLGYTPRSLAMLTAEALLPVHYQMLHAGGIRELMQHKSQHTCRNGGTVLMISSNKALVPVRLSMTHKAEGEDNLLTVVEVAKSSIEAGLDERRIRLEVSPTGEVVSLAGKPCPQALFGVLPEQLVGVSVFRLFPELASAIQSEEEQEEVLEALRLMSLERVAPVYIRTTFGNADLDFDIPDASVAERLMFRARRNLTMASRPPTSELPTASAVHPVDGRLPLAATAPPQIAAPGPRRVEDEEVGADTQVIQASSPFTVPLPDPGPVSGGAPSGPTACPSPGTQPDTAAVSGREYDANADGKSDADRSVGCTTASGDDGANDSAAPNTIGSEGVAEGPPRAAAAVNKEPSGPQPYQAHGSTVGAAGTKAQAPPLWSPVPVPAPAPANVAGMASSASQVATGDGFTAAAAAGMCGPSMARMGSLGSLNAIAAAALARSRLALRPRRLQRHGGGHLGFLPRPVILEVDGTAGEQNLVLSIWHPEKVAAMMEITKEGDIRQAALDELHPPGPVFGLSANALMQYNVRDLLSIKPNLSVLAFLAGTDNEAPSSRPAAVAGTTGPRAPGSSGAKHPPAGARGVLKAGGLAHRKSRSPGPVLQVSTRHADGRPLQLTVQALPKRSSHNSLYVRIHLLTRPGGSDLSLTPATAFNAALGRLCGPGTLVRIPAAVTRTPDGHDGAASSAAAAAAAVPSPYAKNTEQQPGPQLDPNLREAAVLPKGPSTPPAPAHYPESPLQGGGSLRTPARLPPRPATLLDSAVAAAAVAVAAGPMGIEGARQLAGQEVRNPFETSLTDGGQPTTTSDYHYSPRGATSARSEWRHPGPFSLEALSPPSGSAAQRLGAPGLPTSRRQPVGSAVMSGPWQGRDWMHTARTGTLTGDSIIHQTQEAQDGKKGEEQGERGEARQGYQHQDEKDDAAGEPEEPTACWNSSYRNGLFVKQGSSSRRRAEGGDGGDAAAVNSDGLAYGARSRSSAVESEGASASDEASGQRLGPAGRGIVKRLGLTRAYSPTRFNRLAAVAAAAAVTADFDDSTMYDASGSSSPQSVKSACFDEDDPLYLERLAALDTLGPAADEQEADGPPGTAALMEGAIPGEEQGGRRAPQGSMAPHRTDLIPFHGRGGGGGGAGNVVRTTAVAAAAAPRVGGGRSWPRRERGAWPTGRAGGGSCWPPDRRQPGAAARGKVSGSGRRTYGSPEQLQQLEAEASEWHEEAGRGWRQEVVGAAAAGRQESLADAIQLMLLPPDEGGGGDRDGSPAQGRNPLVYGASVTSPFEPVTSLDRRRWSHAVPSRARQRRGSAYGIGSTDAAATTAAAGVSRLDPAADLSAVSGCPPRHMNAPMERRASALGGLPQSPWAQGMYDDWNDYNCYTGDMRSSVAAAQGAPPARSLLPTATAAVPVTRRVSVTFIGGEVPPAPMAASKTVAGGHLQLPHHHQHQQQQRTAGLDGAVHAGYAGVGFPPGGLGADMMSEPASSYLGLDPLPLQEPQRQTDFQRGRRLKRISKVLERPEARTAIRRFSSHSWLIAAVLILSHLACAITIFVLLGQLSSCVTEMGRSGITLDYMHNAALSTRVLDQLHKNRTQAPLYELPDGLESYSVRLELATNAFEMHHVAGFRKTGMAGYRTSLRALWDDKKWRVSYMLDSNTTPPIYRTANQSLFEMGKYFVDSARDIQANHRHYVIHLGINLSETGSFHFIHDEAVWSLTSAYVEVLDSLAIHCIDEASLFNRVMLALLVVEACCICGAACIYLAYRLMQVSKYRCSLFSVFLAIPSATVKALASRVVSADGDDASSESPEGAPTGEASGRGGMQGLARWRSTPSAVAPTAPSIGALSREPPAPLWMQRISAFDGGANAGVSASATGDPKRASFTGLGPLSSQQEMGCELRQAKFQDSSGPIKWQRGDEDGGPAGGRQVAAAGQRDANPRGSPTSTGDGNLQQQNTAHSGRLRGAGLLPSGQGDATASRGEALDSDSGSGSSTGGKRRRASVWESFRTAGAVVTGRCGAAAAAIKNGVASGSRRAVQETSRLFCRRAKMAGTNKVLVAHSLQNWWLVLPIILWAILIISLYAVSYDTVGDIYDSMETLNVASFNVWRMSRLSYFAHELCTRRTLQYRAYLRAQCTAAANEWEALLYGSTRLQSDEEVVLNGTEHHDDRLTVARGIARSGSRMTALLFDTNACMRRDQASCFSPGHPYHAVTHQGMSTIMRAMFRQCELLLADPDDAVTLASPRLSFLFQIGLNDARDGTLRVHDYFEGMLVDKINYVRAIHIGLLVASFILVLVFIFYLVRPFVRYTQEEAKHVAKLLSELGQDIDVERLVENALGVERASGAAGGSSGSRKERGGTSESAARV